MRPPLSIRKPIAGLSPVWTRFTLAGTPRKTLHEEEVQRVNFDPQMPIRCRKAGSKWRAPDYLNAYVTLP
jgi:hypothetical protein